MTDKEALLYAYVERLERIVAELVIDVKPAKVLKDTYVIHTIDLVTEDKLLADTVAAILAGYLLDAPDEKQSKI